MRLLSTLVLCLTAALTPVFAQSDRQMARATPAAPAGGPASVLPGTRATAFVTVQGNALSAGNLALPHVRIRLRDARAGRIIDIETTDSSGLFAFAGVDPGSYVVELLGDGNSVRAASDLVMLNAGEAVSVIVKLPMDETAGGILGRSAGQALALISAAAGSGIMTMAVTREVSPEGTR